MMRRLILCIALVFGALCFLQAQSDPVNGGADTPDKPRKKGAARVEQTRPDHFPHRIWAAGDFEARTPEYAWFGPTETTDIAKYPGNITAQGVKEKPYGYSPPSCTLRVQ